MNWNSPRYHLPALPAPLFLSLALGLGLATTAGAAEPTKEPLTALEVVRHGGAPLFLLGICSVVTLTLIIERYVFYRRAQGNARELVATVKAAGTLSEALTAIEHAPGMAGRVFRSAIVAARDGYPPEQIEQLVQGDVTEELEGLERFLPQLDTFVTMCPLIGLCGTTLGMIHSFSIVARDGFANPTALAGGISEALVNTAAGLLVAIPALFCYNWFTGRKERLLMQLEKGLSQLLVLLKSSLGR